MKTFVFCPAFSLKLLRKNFCSTVFMLFIVSGCASVGHQFPASQVPTIRIGETTQNDIYTTFGSPYRTGIDNGMKTWTYGDYEYGLFKESNAEDLVIKFDKRGIVSSFTYNTTKRAK